MIRPLACLLSAFALSACASAPLGAPVGAGAEFYPRPGQGQYVRPQWLNPAPTPRIPNPDLCRSQLYAMLVGQHEGAIFIPGLPGRKRVIKPASVEDFDYSQDETLYDAPPFLVVRDYIPEQSLYAPSIRTVDDSISLGPAVADRLTIELDREGYVQTVACG